MTNYTKTTDFAAKDSLPSGDSGKIIRGSEFETEFDNIATAVNSKSDANNPTFTGTVTIDGLTVNGNTILGNAATDTVTVTADIASNLIPSADDTYNLGAVGAEWNDLHVDGVAYIDTIDGFATTGDVSFGDNNKAIFGAGSDLQIFHDGSNSYISDSGTGDLQIKGTNLYLKGANNETFMYAVENGPVRLYHDNSQKLITASTGVDVTGTVTADGLNVEGTANARDEYRLNNFSFSRVAQKDGGGGFAGGYNFKLDGSNPEHDSTGTLSGYHYTSGGQIRLYASPSSAANTSATERVRIANNGDISFYEDTGTTAKLTWSASAETLNFADNGKAVFGAGSDLQIYHNGSNSYIDDAGTGSLVIRSNAVNIGKYTGETMAVFTADGSVQLRYDNDPKFETTATGIDVTGTVVADGLTVNVADGNSTSLIGGSGGAGEEAIHVVQSRASFGYVDGKVHVGDLNTSGTTSNKSFELNLSDSPRLSVTSGGDVSFYEDTGTTAKFFWDASLERLGIGTPSPTNNLDIAAAASATLSVRNTSTISSILLSNGSSVNQVFSRGVNSSTGRDLAFVQGTAEAMRIDSSGNLLVGKTVTSLGTAGVTILNTGKSRFTVNGDTAVEVNRLTSDGTIVDFRKDTATVGSIGALSGTSYVAGSSKGVRFGSGALIPTNSAGQNSDASYDLGDSGVRWRDLKLSGGVFLGGTAAANKLDDYEEGTWTPVVADASSGGNTATVANADGWYTKVGNLVSIGIRLLDIDTSGMTSSNAVFITGLPFVSSSTSYGNSGSVILDRVNFTGYVSAKQQQNATHINLRNMISGSLDANILVSAITSTGSDIEISLQYKTA